MPKRTARGSGPSRLPGPEKRRPRRPAEITGPEGCRAAKARSGRASPGLNALAAAQTARHAPCAPSHAPFLRRPRPFDSPAPGSEPNPAGAAGPAAVAQRRPCGVGRELLKEGPRPLRSCRYCRCLHRSRRRACYLRFSNQLELSMPSVSSWAADERAPPCARALLCGLVRARASRPRLPTGRKLLGGHAPPGGIAAGSGAFPAPGCARTFWNVPPWTARPALDTEGWLGMREAACCSRPLSTDPGFRGLFSARWARVLVPPSPRRPPDLVGACRKGREGHLLPRTVMPWGELLHVRR